MDAPETTRVYYVTLADVVRLDGAAVRDLEPSALRAVLIENLLDQWRDRDHDELGDHLIERFELLEEIDDDDEADRISTRSRRFRDDAAHADGGGGA